MTFSSIDVNFYVIRDGMEKIARKSAPVLMVANVIILLASVTVLQDGR